MTNKEFLKELNMLIQSSEENGLSTPLIDKIKENGGIPDLALIDELEASAFGKKMGIFPSYERIDFKDYTPDLRETVIDRIFKFGNPRVVLNNILDNPKIDKYYKIDNPKDSHKEPNTFEIIKFNVDLVDILENNPEIYDSVGLHIFDEEKDGSYFILTEEEHLQNEEDLADVNPPLLESKKRRIETIKSSSDLSVALEMEEGNIKTFFKTWRLQLFSFNAETGLMSLSVPVKTILSHIFDGDVNKHLDIMNGDYERNGFLRTGYRKILEILFHNGRTSSDLVTNKTIDLIKKGK